MVRMRWGRTARGSLSRLAALGIGSLLTASLLLGLSASAALAATYDTWALQRCGTTQNLTGVAFVDAQTGWAVGAGGTIRHTSNAGTSWAGQTSGTTQALNGVTFVDAKTGWAVGGGGVILHTANAGVTWTKQTSGTASTLYGVYFSDALTGWAVGASGAIRHTLDGGSTWKPQPSGTTQTLSAVAFADANNGWAGGNRGTQLHTSNGGASWTMIYLGKKQTLYAVLFADAANGWETGSNGVIRHTTNGGTSWATPASGTRSALYGATVGSDGNGWVVGGGGVIRHMSAGGTTWSAQTSGTTHNLRAVARAGRNIYAVGDGGTIIASIADLTPPATKASGLQADNGSGWTNAGATVTLTATDARSGVASTYYTLDGIQSTYSAPFSVTVPGQHEVTFWSVDKVGNVEEPHSGWVNIDVTPPTVGADADAAWHNSEVAVTLSPADGGGSGVAATQYRVQGGTIWLTAAGNTFTVPAPASGTNDGEHFYEFRAVDGAGNPSSIGSCSVKIDATPAATTATGLADALTGWTTTDRLVTLTATDGHSGAAVTKYTVDGVEKTYAGTFTVAGAGRHAVTYWSVDNAGNVEAVHTGWVNIGSVYAEPTNLAADDHSGWRNTSAAVTITGGGDNASATVSYQVDGAGWQTVASPASFDVSGVGNHKIEYYATDSFYLASSQLTGYVNIETTAPITKAGLVPAGWRHVNVVVPLTATDAQSGVAHTYYRIDGRARQEAAGAAIVPALADHTMDGRHVVSYYSVDAAGNVEVAKTFVVRIDTRRPVPKAPYAAAVLRYRYVKLRCFVADAKPCAGRAALKILVRNRSGKIVRTLKCASVRTGVWLAPRFLCKLPRGTYRFYVYATDAAGNTQLKVASNRLTVR